jgi:hypothetical protein
MKRFFSLSGKLLRFYYDGFMSMSDWGKKVWLIILIKLFIMFVILKIFFFQDFLNRNFPDEKKKSEYVIDQLLNSSENHDK